MILFQRFYQDHRCDRGQAPLGNRLKRSLSLTGQAIAEVLIALGIGAILLVAASGGIALFLRQNYETRGTQVAATLAQEYFDQVKALAESNWQTIYVPPGAKGPGSQFHLAPSGVSFAVFLGSTTTVRENQVFTRLFSIENVNRDSCGVGNVTTNSASSCGMQSGPGFVAEDPSTQKITVTVAWADGRSIAAVEYVSRTRNRTFAQTDWSGGAGVEGVIELPARQFATSTNINYTTSTGSFAVNDLGAPSGGGGANIDPVYRYAWSESVGWIDFYATGNVSVSSTQLVGYASSSVGYIALNCATSPNGNICGTSNFRVVNDGNGNLTGWAWNDAVGWISFDSGSATSSISYQVTINPANGEWSGWAWSDAVGWISMNCANTSSCGVSDYKVKTTWFATPTTGDLTSSVFDTGVASGTALNSILWQGNLPSGAAVQFRFASSNCANGATDPPACVTGSWNFMGPDGTATTYYAPGAPSASAALHPGHHHNKRYFRYKVFLYTDSGRTVSPRVDDVIINWSP